MSYLCSRSGERVAIVVEIGDFAVGAIVAGFPRLYLYFAMKTYRGRNWARVTLTVVAVLGSASLLALLLVETISAAQFLEAVLAVSPPVASVVFTWLPTSSAFVWRLP